jgi:hypothetical protein
MEVILWKRYIQLVEAQWAFRIAKDKLENRYGLYLPFRSTCCSRFRT